MSNLAFAQKEYQRELNLFRKNLTSQALIDDRKHTLDVASENRVIIEKERAQLLANLNGRADAPLSEYSEVMEAQADLDLANINLQHTKVMAPFDGYVSHLPKLGQHLDPGSPVLSLVSDKHVWIEANFKETDLVNLHVDQNATGNWIKVVQRVPIRIRLQTTPSDPALRAGMSAYVEIDTRASVL